MMKFKEIFDKANGDAKKIMLYLRKEDNLKLLINETNNLSVNIDKSTRYYCWLNKLTGLPVCPYCGKPRKFHDLQKGFFTTCGDAECRSKAKSDANRNRVVDWTEVHRKMEETYAVNHNGIRHNMQDPEFKEKFYEEYKKKHNGETCGVQSKKAIENRAKAFEEKYDGSVRNAFEQGVVEKYGSWSECAKQSAKKSRDKIVETKTNTLIKRIESIGNYEYISSSDTMLTLKCKECGNVFVIKRSVFNDKCRNNDFNFCDNCGFYKLIEQYNVGDISSRMMIARIKSTEQFIVDLKRATLFLNEYNPTVVERLYYVINNLGEVVRCEYCNNKAKWNDSDVLEHGYSITCCSKECESKRCSERMLGSTVISENRINNFIEWQNNVIDINDEIVVENISYYKLLSYITNQKLLDYLNNRYTDSDSIEETLQRMKLGIEKKPICANPDCNNPVKWIGRKRALYTTYCCDSCAANSEERLNKFFATNIRNWGTKCVYDSFVYQKQYYNKTGYHYSTQVPEIKEKMYQSKKKNNSWCGSTSKLEQKLFSILKNELGYEIETHYKSDLYPFVCDIYIPSLDLYIEYQGWQGHGEHPYTGSAEDNEILEKWKMNEEIVLRTNKTSQYTGMINTWTISDPEKRRVARENNLNYLEIFKFKNAKDVKRQIDDYLNSKK